MIQLEKPSTKQPTVQVQERCAGTSVPATASGTLSPTKHIGLRSECINQLDRWYSLLEKGAITQESSIMKTMVMVAAVQSYSKHIYNYCRMNLNTSCLCNVCITVTWCE